MLRKYEYEYEYVNVFCAFEKELCFESEFVFKSIGYN